MVKKHLMVGLWSWTRQEIQDEILELILNKKKGKVKKKLWLKFEELHFFSPKHLWLARAGAVLSLHIVGVLCKSLNRFIDR